MYLDLTLKLSVGLLALITVVRLLGKKELAQLTPFDFVYIVILSGILEESLFDEKIKVTHFLYAISLWAFLVYIIERLTKKWNPLRRLLKGEPVRMIANGQLDMKKFDKYNLEMEQLRSALRKQGIFSLREVRDLFLEPGGDITINRFSDFNPVTKGDLKEQAREQEPTLLFVDEGEIKEEVLSYVGKDSSWLQAELAKMGYRDLADIAYCEWSETESFFVRTY